MWLSILLVCLTPLATSCNVMAKTKELFSSERQCKEDGSEVASNLINQRIYAISICMKIGETA
tara:strand:- start:15097 stop:15285 length:189 start_codon:yes stop_codon:yes gene_type:complete